MCIRYTIPTDALSYEKEYNITAGLFDGFLKKWAHLEKSGDLNNARTPGLFEQPSDEGQTSLKKDQYPFHNVPVIINSKITGHYDLIPMRWGLIPPWAKYNTLNKYKLVNARIETLAEKKAFQKAYQSRRAILPATGFYEYDAQKKMKYFPAEDGRIYSIAALWEISSIALPNRSKENFLSVVMVTTTADSRVRPYHDRMPRILSIEERQKWMQNREF